MNYWDDATIGKIRKGYYSAIYFNRTKYILEKEKNYKVVTMQVFQKNEESMLCGIDEVVELLKIGAGYWDPSSSRFDRDFGEARWISRYEDIEIKTLKDGDRIDAWESVMHLTGPYVYFAHLESIYLGILARRSLVASNTRKAVEAAGCKPVVFFADRFDHFLNQEGDGYAAQIGGASAITTEAQRAWVNAEIRGTIPHALIAINDGNSVTATEQFAKHITDAQVVALVDFENDCVKTALEVARVLQNKLWGVRLDTAEDMIDRSFTRSHLVKERGATSLRGVNPTLVKLVRKGLDQEGFQHVKIIVSGGLSAEKIKWFESEKAPVDVYGVGSALVHGNNDFTADIVIADGKKIAKAGREYRLNNRLQLVKLD